MCYVTCKFK